MKYPIRSLVIVALMGTNPVTPALQAESPSKLEPLMAIPDEVVLKNDFSEQKALDKKVWQSRQGTRWAIEDGVLRGQQSSPEYQVKKKDHRGFEPRLSILVTPPEFVAAFSFRFLEGQENAIVPFIEFGHHVCRVRFSKDGMSLLSDHEVMKLAEDKGFVWQSGKWYQALAEMKGDEFVFQVADGPTLYAKRDSFESTASDNGHKFGIAGPKKGIVELDNMTIWTVKKDTQASWGKGKSGLPVFEPIQVKEPKTKKEPKVKKAKNPKV